MLRRRNPGDRHGVGMNDTGRRVVAGGPRRRHLKLLLWLIRLQHIYNILLFHAIILPVLDVYGLYFALLYHLLGLTY